MKFRVTIQPEAEASLVQGALWWAKHRSQKQAIEWWLGFEEAIAGLSDKPDQYPLSRESSKFPYPVRQLLVEPAQVYILVQCIQS